MKRLSERIQSVDLASKETEETLGTLRDQVAEKIRVKRLLSRLDALLKLPQTLGAQIASGKYRTATRSYISASTILSKHSQGFESLRNIETDCTKILQDMKSLLIRKLMHWNGRLRTDLDYDSMKESIPEPPKNMTEIFECVGTLHILLEDQSILPEISQQEVDNTETLDKNELQSLALGAATRALDRILDAHMIQVQDRRFAILSSDDAAGALDLRLSSAPLETKANSGGAGGAVVDGIPLTASAAQPQGAALVPREFLDAILEVATLYGMSFGGSVQVGLLTDFISEAFSSFSSHVRSVLLEQSGHIKEVEETNLAGSILPSPSGEETASEEEEISNALALLVQAVREMAAGLSLPEVGVNPDFASGLVDEAMQLADSMVNRRVHQKFNDLRARVVKDCLLSFVQKLIEQEPNAKGALDREYIAKARAVASTTLSDCLQLVDDTIRSIVSGAGGGGSDGTPEATTTNTTQSSENLSPVVKEAVQDSTKEFTDWLAGALEVLAGGEASNTNWVVYVPQDGQEGNDDEDVLDTAEVAGARIEPSSPGYGNTDGYGDGKDSENLMELIQSVRLEPRGRQDDSGGVVVGGGEIAFIIAIAEMCRLAQGSLSENLEQSMALHLGTGKRRSRHTFSGGSDQVLQSSKASEEDDEISLRFRLAASRVFALYTTQKGEETAALLVADMENLTSEGTVSCDSPRKKICEALSTIKSMAVECSNIFDGPIRAGPVPMMDIVPVGGLPTPSLGFSMKSSLQIDVERIFKEKLVIHLHPSELLDFSRSALIFCTMKVAYRALLESIRLHLFSTAGFQQLQVDVEFLRLMIPHYIDEEFAVHGNNAFNSLSNLLADVMEAVGDRCVDEGYANDEHVKNESLSILRHFMSQVIADENFGGGVGSLFIIADDS